MSSSKRPSLILAGCAVVSLASLSLATTSRGFPASERQAPQPAAQNPAGNQVGTIKAVSGNTITLVLDKGAEVTVVAQASTRIVRVAPSQADLKNAVVIQLSDLQVGDRILVRGKQSDDAKSFSAAGIIAMKRSDVEAKQQQEREDWQRRGTGGLVSAVDPASGTITISVAGPGGTKAVAIHTAKDTILRRYAPDSVKFDDAKPSTMDQVKTGDQLRARGARSADGTDLAAEEIVSGAFRNIAGTINNLDAATSTLTVMDLATKKPVQVKISAQSQVLKLPTQIAQGLAFQMKGGARGPAPGGTASGAPPSGTAAGERGAPPSETAPGERGAPPDSARPGQRAADLQQVLNRLPKASLAELQKGDAVMIVSTEGTTSGGVTAITLLAGVEPILQASPGGAQAMTLSPWNIGGAGGEAGDANP
jgi:hypothetical protein